VQISVSIIEVLICTWTHLDRNRESWKIDFGAKQCRNALYVSPKVCAGSLRAFCRKERKGGNYAFSALFPSLFCFWASEKRANGLANNFGRKSQKPCSPTASCLPARKQAQQETLCCRRCSCNKRAGHFSRHFLADETLKLDS
jgi:hypothetical protein